MRVIAAALAPLALAALAQPAVARPRPPVTITVTMADRKFHPDVVTMPAGRPVVLRLVNVDRTEHGFSATAFFAAASFPGGQVGKIENGAVAVRSHETRTIRLIASPGDYPLSSKKALDQASGMTGRILVR